MKNILTGPFQVNTWIIPLAENKVLVVDPAACSYIRDTLKIVSYLTEASLEPAGFLLTHGHFDHITGTAVGFCSGGRTFYDGTFRTWCGT